MKKIMIMFLFLLSSVFSFSAINDNLNLLKDEEKAEINEKIEEIAKPSSCANVFTNIVKPFSFCYLQFLAFLL